MTSSQRRGGCEVGETSRGGEGGIEERLVNRDGSDMCPEGAHIEASLCQEVLFEVVEGA